MVEEGQNQHKIGPKRMKLKEIEEKGEVDRVSVLPDCLLVEILSRLCSIKGAARTGCILNPNGAINWKNLTSLSISNGKLDEDLIENILSGSPVLETLVLNDCYGYRLLNITSKSIKNLVFDGYYAPEGASVELDDIIEINAPNILTLTIQDRLSLWKLLLLNVTSLIEAKLDYWNNDCIHEEEEEEMLKGFIVNLCHVKELQIGVHCFQVLSRLVAKGFDLPSNIRFLDGPYEQMEQGDSSESEYEFESDEDN